MGKTYKAVEITKPGTFRLVEKPVVGPGEERIGHARQETQGAHRVEVGVALDDGA